MRPSSWLPRNVLRKLGIELELEVRIGLGRGTEALDLKEFAI